MARKKGKEEVTERDEIHDSHRRPVNNLAILSGNLE
jgi:hypothetical protein